MERDLTVGSVPKQLLSFAAPLFLANLLQSLYSIVDMAVVGRFVGSAGLAAVSSAAMLSFIIQSVCTGVTTGGAVLIAQYKGARDTRGQRETAGALFSVSALAALLVTAAGLLAYRPVFSLMNLPAEALPHALRYMRVICLGTVFVFGYNAVCSVLRGLGDSKSPLFFVAVATAVNILLDLLLVGPLGLGTEGAAIATAASQGVSFLTAVFVLRRRGLPLDFSPSYFRTAPKTCRAILRIGFPTAVQMTVLNLSYLLVTGMLNGYGVAVAAAAGVGLTKAAASAPPGTAPPPACTSRSAQCLSGSRIGTCIPACPAPPWPPPPGPPAPPPWPAGPAPRHPGSAGRGFRWAPCRSPPVCQIPLYTPGPQGRFVARPRLPCSESQFLFDKCSVLFVTFQA